MHGADPNDDVDYDANELNQYVRWDYEPSTGTPVRQTYEHDADGDLTDTWAAADANCDTVVTFIDVGYFVAGLNGEENWKQYYRDRNGGAEPGGAHAVGAEPGGAPSVHTVEAAPGGAGGARIGAACQSRIDPLAAP